MIRVLHIEDNSDEALLIQRMLVKAKTRWSFPHFDLKWADCLDAGLKQLDVGGVDVVLADLSLPDSDVKNTFTQLRAHAPRLPVVVLSGWENEKLALQFAQAGVQDYLFKTELTSSLLARTLCFAIERQQAEDALRESEELHRITLGSISDAVFVTDNVGAFVYISPNVDVIFGYSFRQAVQFGNIVKLLGNQIFDPAELDAVGEIANIEQEIFDQAGRKHTLLVNVKRVSIKGGTTLYTCRDITERKQAEKALRNSERRLRATINGAPIILFTLDRQGNFTSIEGRGLQDNQILQTIGPKPDDLIGKPIFQVFPDFQQIKDNLERALGGDTLTSVGYIFDRVFETHLSPLQDQHGNAVGLIGVATDITERKRIEQHKIGSERLAAMGHIAAILAHELKNPLQALHSNLELVLEFPLSPDEKEEHLYVCRQEVENLTDVIQRMLDLFLPTQDAPTLVSIKRLFEQALALAHQPLKDAGVQVTVDIPADIETVLVAPNQFVHVLWSLLVNTVESQSGKGNIHVQAHTNQDTLTLVITNDALRTPPEHIQQFLDPFTSGKPDDVELEFPLSQSSGQEHNVTMRAHSLRNNQGVAFTFTLPHTNPDSDILSPP